MWAKYLDFLPLPLVRTDYWFTLQNSLNLPYCVGFSRTPSPLRCVHTLWTPPKRSREARWPLRGKPIGNLWPQIPIQGETTETPKETTFLPTLHLPIATDGQTGCAHISTWFNLPQNESETPKRPCTSIYRSFTDRFNIDSCHWLLYHGKPCKKI